MLTIIEENARKRQVQEIGAKIALLCDSNHNLEKELSSNKRELQTLEQTRITLLKELL